MATPWTVNDYNAGKLNTQNFSWGVQGKGTQGVDYGSTSGWSPQQWVDYNNQYNPNPNTAQPATNYQPVAAQPAAPAQPTAPTDQNVDDAYRTQLMTLLNTTNPSAVNQQTPAVQAQTDMYSAGRQMAQRQEQEQIAEQMAAKNMSGSGAENAAIQGSVENMGRDIGGAGAQAVQGEQARQTDVLKSILAMGGSGLSEQERNALSQKIAELSNATQMAGINQQGTLGQGDLSLRRYLGDSSNSIALLEALMQNQQFSDNFGLQLGTDEAGLNNDAITSILKGL